GGARHLRLHVGVDRFPAATPLYQRPGAVHALNWSVQLLLRARGGMGGADGGRHAHEPAAGRGFPPWPAPVLAGDCAHRDQIAIAWGAVGRPRRTVSSTRAKP